MAFEVKRQGIFKKDLDDFFKYLILISVSSNSVFICLNSRSSNRNFIDNLHIFNMFEVPEELNKYFSTTVEPRNGTLTDSISTRMPIVTK